MNQTSVIAKLAETYPQLYLDPDREEKEAYRKIVLEGENPETKSLAHFSQNPLDREETVDQDLWIKSYGEILKKME